MNVLLMTLVPLVLPWHDLYGPIRLQVEYYLPHKRYCKRNILKTWVRSIGLRCAETKNAKKKVWMSEVDKAFITCSHCNRSCLPSLLLENIMVPIICSLDGEEIIITLTKSILESIGINCEDEDSIIGGLLKSEDLRIEYNEKTMIANSVTIYTS